MMNFSQEGWLDRLTSQAGLLSRSEQGPLATAYTYRLHVNYSLVPRIWHDLMLILVFTGFSEFVMSANFILHIILNTLQGIEAFRILSL